MPNEGQGINWLGLVQAAVLTGWSIALGWLGHGSAGDRLLGRFLRPDYWWIVYLALWVFVALLASLAFSQPRQRGLDRRRSLIQAIILSLPLLSLPLAVSSELSVEAAEKRSLFAPRAVMKQSEPPKAMAVRSEASREMAGESSSSYTPRVIAKRSASSKPTQTERKLKISLNKSRSAATPVKSHEANLWNLISDPEAFRGSNATVVGVVYNDKRLPGNSFFCYRLLMVCCAADASPVGVMVKWPETPRLKTGSWVKARGKVVFTMFEGQRYPAISATKVEKTSPPKNRFLIPK